MLSSKLTDRPWKKMLWIAVIAALSYLPHTLQLTYFRDDWYYAYDALVGPAGVFRYMFAGDRPARGPLFELYQALFGMAPTPYHLAMLLWRIAGGMAVVWLFHLLWGRRSAAGFAAGALFGLYPGFTWWVQGIEYQPMVASATLMVISLGLTIKALRLQRSWLQVTCVAGAVVSGWLYLGLVEYAAGMEAFRLCLIFLVVSGPELRSFGSRARVALRTWLVYLIIPVGFVLWRFVFFASERKATDLGAQLGGFLADPLLTGLRWIMNLIVSLINVTLAAWVQPLSNNFFSGTLREQAFGLGLAFAAGVLGWLLLRQDAASSVRKKTTTADNWQMHAIWLGLAGLLLGIVPVVVANRQIALPSFSHYALPASLGLVFAVVGIVSLISDQHVQRAVFGGLIFLSALTHQGLGASAVREERTIAAFWHQMVWRASSISPGTTLLVYYPDVDYGSDSDVVWGPANFVYYLQAQEQLPVRVQISALTPDRGTLDAILAGKDVQESTYRAHNMIIDYGNVLIAVQSAADACVRVLDPRWPTYSLADDLALRSLATSSRLDTVEVSGSGAVPPASLFGTEPEHNWCFYFQKAASASQYGKWHEVAAIQDEIGRLGLHPNDQIEWMPFLQAQAYLGDLEAVKEIATRINTEKVYRQQACSNLTAMAGHGYPLPPESQAYVNELFCGGTQ